VKTVQFLVCEGCEQPILKPECGVVVQGNIYSAGLERRTCLVGDNLPVPDQDGKFSVYEIREMVYCRTCFIKALGWDQKPHDPTSFKLQFPPHPTWADSQ